MSGFTYECNVNKEEILDAVKNREDYDTWGDVMYGNEQQAVDYNICIDNSTKETEYCSAFYRMFVNEEGCWQHDSCQEWYPYEIDFSDENWKERLREVTVKAYEVLWENK